MVTALEGLVRKNTVSVWYHDLVYQHFLAGKTLVRTPARILRKSRTQLLTMEEADTANRF